jgi:exopolyphosphatase / guanosine-5'-triphosphate,3'-diphosphate pyrophosphatase
MPNKIAVIDCGTNTFNLLIAQADENLHYKIIHQTRVPVKLGEGTINSGFIAQNAFQRGIEALVYFAEIMNEYNCKGTFAFATSALRTASNAVEFLSHAEEASGINIQVISGDREAELIYKGNKTAVKMSLENSLIMDIGGGSTEFIIANKERIIWKESFMLGVARLFNRFHFSDPIKEDQIQSFYSFLEEQLRPLREAIQEYEIIELIGASGAFDSIVELIEVHFNGPSLEPIQTEYNIDLHHFKRISEKLIRSTLEERKNLPGLIPMRADMMVVSVLLMKYIMETFNIQQLKVSSYSLKEGVLAELSEREIIED